MRIQAIKTYVLSQRLNDQSFCYSQAWYDSRTILLLEMITDDGLCGFGESFGNAYANQTIVDRIYAPAILGEDVFASERIWDSLYQKMRDNGQKGSPVEAISAIDIALWDLKGQYVRMPVHRLLGGARRERVLPYATGLYRSKSKNLLKDLVGEAEGYARQGFRAIKIKIGFGPEADLETIGAVRGAIGNIKLMVDANHAYTAHEAIRLSNAMEKYDVEWFEEPVPPEDIEGYREVKAKTRIAVAGGEAEFTRYGFDRLLSRRAVDIVQPDCCVTGGLSEAMKIATLATVHNIQCFPHIWGSAVALRTGIHFAFALPDFPGCLNPRDVYVELDRTPNVFREQLSPGAYRLDGDGYMAIDDEPGLGLHIDRSLIEKYRVR